MPSRPGALTAPRRNKGIRDAIDANSFSVKPLAREESFVAVIFYRDYTQDRNILRAFHAMEMSHRLQSLGSVVALALWCRKVDCAG